MKNKKVTLIIGAVVLVAAVVAGWFGYRGYTRQKQLEYEQTYITIAGTEYRRDAASIDLRGTLDSPQGYEAIQAELPNCEILWSVPLQDGRVDSNAASVTVENLTEEDIALLAYLPALKTVDAENCGDLQMLELLRQTYPDLEILRSVTIGGKTYTGSEETLDIPDPQVGELMENLQQLPNVKTVNLTGTLPDNETLIDLKKAYPEITFVWEFQLCGVTVNTAAEFIDLSDIPLKGIEEVEAALPCFYNLKQVDMCDCGIDSPTMDALNKRYPETKFVWEVTVARNYQIRTDSTYFMPSITHLPGVNDGTCANLRYCTDLMILDLGHMAINSCAFVEYMPNLEFLILGDSSVVDITPVGTLNKLRFLELFKLSITDYTPLLNLAALEDLNLSATFYGDINQLQDMPWLDRLWLVCNRDTKDRREALQEALPNTMILFADGSSTDRGWRFAPNYFEYRDIVGMWYMVK